MTNTAAGNKSFSKRQIKQSYPKHSLSSVYRGQLLFLSKIHLLGSKGRNDIPTTRPGVKDVHRAQMRTRSYSKAENIHCYYTSKDSTLPLLTSISPEFSWFSSTLKMGCKKPCNVGIQALLSQNLMIRQLIKENGLD